MNGNWNISRWSSLSDVTASSRTSHSGETSLVSLFFVLITFLTLLKTEECFISMVFRSLEKSFCSDFYI